MDCASKPMSLSLQPSVPKVLPKKSQVQRREDAAGDTQIPVSSRMCKDGGGFAVEAKTGGKVAVSRAGSWGQVSLGLSCSDRTRILKSFLALVAIVGVLLCWDCFFYQIAHLLGNSYRSDLEPICKPPQVLQSLPMDAGGGACSA